jgi:integrase
VDGNIITFLFISGMRASVAIQGSFQAVSEDGTVIITRKEG